MVQTVKQESKKIEFRPWNIHMFIEPFDDLTFSTDVYVKPFLGADSVHRKKNKLQLLGKMLSKQPLVIDLLTKITDADYKIIQHLVFGKLIDVHEWLPYGSFFQRPQLVMLGGILVTI